MQDKLIDIKNMTYIPGYLYHFKQPSLLAFVTINKADSTLNTLIQNFDLTISKTALDYTIKNYQTDHENIVQRIVTVMHLVSNKAKIPLISRSTITLHQQFIQIQIPILGSDFTPQKKLLLILVNLFNGEHKNFQSELETIFQSISKVAPKGINSKKILEVAAKNDIPWRQYQNNIFQLGWGKYAVLFDSSISSHTSALAVNTARDKMATKNILRSLALPVPEGYIVKSLDEAKKYAEGLTYPVVIKPTNQDRGEGVTAWIQNEKMLEEAFTRASKCSKNILIEKHFEGMDHRLHICQNELYYATLRVPGSIMGNGIDSVEILINKVNKHREVESQKEKKSFNFLKHLEVNVETIELLEEQGLTLQSIPQKDQFIRLRYTANVSSGGTSHDTENLATIHSDNIELAKRAVNALRLDIGAVDLLIPDITKSWMETGAAILEVNAQPQIGKTVAIEFIFNKYFEKKGRIPVSVFIGDYTTSLQTKFTKKLFYADKTIGIVARDHLYKNERIISNKVPLTLHERGIALVNDPEIEGMILFVENFEMLRHGFPIDKFEQLIVLGIDEKNVPILEQIKRLAQETIFHSRIAGKIRGNNKTLHIDEIVDRVYDLHQ